MYQLKDLLNSSQFQQEVIEQDYLVRYEEEQGRYPRVQMRFYEDPDDTAEYEYTSRYTKDEKTATGETQPAGYQNWSFSDFKNEQQEIPPKP
ncbi:hypothetical protein [Brevibacillus dissolubilis]|uniref:hypothetical protein n=1 Tax=Brevibacillus dissolubilis TaxID=1844116 RepID=UPI001115DE3A|nr:hypothetical protein [Brevibacillus dissolubilis]